MPEPLERDGISRHDALLVAADLARIIYEHSPVFGPGVAPITCAHGRCDGANWADWAEFSGHLAWVLVEPSTGAHQHP